MDCSPAFNQSSHVLYQLRDTEYILEEMPLLNGTGIHTWACEAAGLGRCARSTSPRSDAYLQFGSVETILRFLLFPDFPFIIDFIQPMTGRLLNTDA